ncbi:helix-turn-helix transcriptional regulator [Streptomyces aureus]|uniref:helix-turn-helix transcriptional regulator n=1 Tax=Streptomyces aureus TaxID=193461 RepID=UPI00099BCB55|nr:helix-turn-helix transcriptional regulator [Streptomyces aureus]
MPQKPKPLDDSQSMAHWFGVELRTWRELRGLSTTSLGAMVQLSGSSIQRIEKGERSCNASLAASFDDALDARGALRRLWRRVEANADNQSRDADKRQSEPSAQASNLAGPGTLGAKTHPDVDGSDVERRSFLAGGAALLSPLGLATPDSASLPKVIRRDDVEQVWMASALLARWDNQYGGVGLVRSASIGLYRWATSLLGVRCPGRLEPELFTAVGRLAVVMGASAFDAYEHDDARLYLSAGVECAERAGNWHLRASAMNWLARQAIWIGEPDDGLTHAENGLVRSDRLTPKEQAMLHNARARAFAKMRDIDEAVRAIGRSDEIFAQATVGEDAPWMSYYDRAQHHGDTGHALFDLTLLAGHSPAASAERLEIAIAEHGDGYVRSRALSGTKLASLRMATGDPQEAVTVGHRALDEVGRLRSRRAVDDVQELRRIAASRSRSAGVADLRERIRTTVQA